MDPLLILFVLSLNIAFCEFLVRRTAARHLGTALLVILVTAITANLGLVPTYSGEVAIYGAIFDVVAPLGIFLLLLNVGLRQVLRAGSSMLTLFLIGAIGTVAGVVTGMAVIGGSEALGPKAPALGGMFVGTYVGGSINFNAIALEFKVREFPLLYAGANAVDALMTVVWMAATIALPRLLARFWPPSTRSVEIAATAEETNHHEAERVDPLQLTLLLAMGLGCVKASNWLAEQSKAWFASPEDQTEVHGIPAILILTTIALCLAQWPRIRAIAGSRLLGLLAVYYFLAVIGALCDIAAMGELGGLL